MYLLNFYNAIVSWPYLPIRFWGGGRLFFSLNNLVATSISIFLLRSICLNSSFAYLFRKFIIHLIYPIGSFSNFTRTKVPNPTDEGKKYARFLVLDQTAFKLYQTQSLNTTRPIFFKFSNLPFLPKLYFPSFGLLDQFQTFPKFKVWKLIRWKFVNGLIYPFSNYF